MTILQGRIQRRSHKKHARLLFFQRRIGPWVNLSTLDLRFEDRAEILSFAGLNFGTGKLKPSCLTSRGQRRFNLGIWQKDLELGTGFGVGR